MAAILSLAAGAVGLVATTSAPSTAAAAKASQTLAVDFARTTGAFRGGASGTLYGLGDQGVPTPALVNGAHLTNSSQKAPFGTQHPSGDALKVEDNFFAKHGEDLYVYVQDYYPDWPYNGNNRPGDNRTYDQATGSWTAGSNGIWDYLEVVEIVTQAVATQSDHPEDYVFIPVNEGDLQWYRDYGTMKTTFLDDWNAIYAKIQQVYTRNGLGHAKVGGPGDASWRNGRTADLLDNGKANNTLPDVMIWHELGIDNLRTYRGHVAEYRALEQARSISPIPINITEYGMLRDMGVPGQLIQWFSMFEDTKVDAQTAYWNYAGNLSDNTAGPNGANGGWWLFKWYGDLEGSQTVKVTPPSPDTADTLQGIGAIDVADKRATVLYGGTDADVSLALSGIDTSTFGSRVDVTIREATLTGAEGLSDDPRVVAAYDDVAVVDGTLQIASPTYDRYAAYQLVITPSAGRDAVADAAAQPWSTSVEAEDTQLVSAQAFTQDPTAGGGWKFMASHGRDVGAFNNASARSTFTVDVPRTGTYRLQVIGGAPGVPGRHALFIDGTFDQLVQYKADLALTQTAKWQYRGSSEVMVQLTKGQHEFSLRGSRDGTTALPNVDITLDKYVLTDAGADVTTRYPASGFRLYDGARLAWDATGGAARLANGQRADLYLTSMDTGYHDLTVHWASSGASSVTLTRNGQPVGTLTAPSAGEWASTVRVHLVEGINELEVRSPGAAVRDVTTTRVVAADAAEVTTEGEDMVFHGAAKKFTLAASTGSNASGMAGVGGVGNGAANTVDVVRSADTVAAPGQYDLTVYYANAETSGRHDYNPQVVDRRIEVTEDGKRVGSEHFRYTYAWTSFSQRTMHLALATQGGALTLGNPTAYAPDIDRVQLAPVTLGQPSTVAAPAPSDPGTGPETPATTPSTTPSTPAPVTQTPGTGQATGQPAPATPTAAPVVKAKAARKAVRSGAKAKIVVQVDNAVPGSLVRVIYRGRTKTVAVRDGRAVAKIRVRGAGKQSVEVAYLATPTTTPVTTAVTVRVVRR